MRKTLPTFILLFCISSLIFGQEQWTLINTSNSEIPSDRTISLGITTDDVVYIGTPGGLVSPSHVYNYNGTYWTEMDWFASFTGMKNNPDGHLAIATGEGVYHYDGTSHELFNKGNSNLTSNTIACIDVGTDGKEYIGMTAAGLLATGGLGIYDGSFWAIYNTDNSPLPVDNVLSIFVSKTGILWVGSQDAGLVRKEGDNWEIFNTDNSDIPENRVSHMAESNSGILWMAFANGSIATFDGTDWSYIRVFKGNNFPESNVTDMLFDSDDNLWMSFESDGFAKFDGTDWSYFTSLLSPLPGDEVTGLELDSEGLIWISTEWDGLAIFDPDFGSAIDDFISPENIVIYPNPVTSHATVKLEQINEDVDLYIYDLTGRLIINQEINETVYQINCDKLKRGYYILKLKSKKGIIFSSKSFIKQ